MDSDVPSHFTDSWTACEAIAEARGLLDPQAPGRSAAPVWPSRPKVLNSATSPRESR
jgi:hypothetical protein